MNKRHLWKAAAGLICAGVIALLAWRIPSMMAQNPSIPGLTAAERVLLRIWVMDSPGGAQPWLKQELARFEKMHPGISTWLRLVSPEDLTDPEAILPDIVLYMPGNVTSPETRFLPLSGEMAARDGLLREELLRCGRWRGNQYALPLCWGAWVLAIDSALEPGQALTPAPTTLLGRPAATSSIGATPEPGYPLAAASQAECALQSPGGAALFSLGLLLEDRPPLPGDFATRSAGDVYGAFQQRKTATAILTTGQAIGFASLTSAGSGFPHRIMAPEEIITDQVWLASVTADAPREAALLLSHLASTDAQKALSAQGLHTVRSDLTLYASGMSAQVEQAAKQALSAINAYIPAEEVQAAAWQFFQEKLTLSEALLPLM